MFPKIAGEVIEVRGNTLTLDKGQKDGVLPGLELEVYREGREIKHPKTGELLGRAEEPLGRTRITSVQEAFSQATTTAAGIKPGDRYRVPSAKVNLVLLPLLGGVREGLVEAAIQELVERLGATGRFRVSMGDPINVYLTQEGIKAEEFLQGKGVQQAAQRFKLENLLAIYFKRVQNKPYMEVRFYTPPAAGSRDQHGVLRAALHQIGGRAGRQVLLGRRARESTAGQAAVAPGPTSWGRSGGRQLLERGGDDSAAPGGPIRLPGSGHGRGDRSG